MDAFHATSKTLTGELIRVQHNTLYLHHAEGARSGTKF
jgi:hypothetical protein